MADFDGITDITDLSGNGKGVALNVYPDPVIIQEGDETNYYGAAAGMQTNLLFTDLSLTTLTVETIIRTAGYRVAGTGGAYYVFDAAVDAAFVAANPMWSFRTLNGRGFRLSEDQRLTFDMFGAYANFNPVTPGTIGVNFQDDYPAMAALLAFMEYTKATTSGNTVYKATPPVFFPADAYYMSETVDLSRAVYDFTGTGRSGMTTGSTFYFAAGKDGFRFQFVNTFGKLGTGSFPYLTSGTTFRHIHAYSLGNNTTGSDTGSGLADEQDGFCIRAQVCMYSCSAINFSRHGFHIYAANGTSIQGNANGGYYEDCSGTRNRKCGIYVAGGDANACIFNRFSGYHNGYAGIWDNSFLGNTWINPESGDNGAIGTGPFWGFSTVGTFVRHDAGDGAGLYIWQVRRGMAVAASTTAPANVIGNPWMRLTPGYVNTIYPEWFSGISVIDGAGYIFENSQSSSVLIGGYTEGTDPAPSFAGGGAIAIGGLLAGTVVKGPGLFASNNRLSSRTGFQQRTHQHSRVDGKLVINQFGTNNPETSTRVLFACDGRYSDLAAPLDPVIGTELAWDTTTRDLAWYETGTGAQICRMTNLNTTLQFGRGVKQHGYLQTNRFMLGNGNNARELGSSTAMPTSGTYAQGDFIHNSLPAVAGGKILLGWARLTNGANHVLNTDWSNCYVTTS